MRLVFAAIVVLALALPCAVSASFVGGAIEGEVLHKDFNSAADFADGTGVKITSRADLSAAVFSGSTSCIEVADDPKLHTPSAMSLAMWIRPEAVSAVQVPLMVKEGSWGAVPG